MSGSGGRHHSGESVNYYERHLGDYARDTGHLTLVEHGVYTVLLDRYYATEEAIPADQVYRLARARTEEERQAVDNVLEDFFTKEEKPSGFCWVNRRVEEEIEKARLRIETARENGKKGGRPPKKTKNNPNKTHREPGGFSLGCPNETQQKAHQTPDTNHQEKQKQKTAPDGELFDGIDPVVVADFKALRSRQRAPVTKTAMAGIRREAQAAGLTVQEALVMCCERSWRGFKAEWVHDARDRPGGTDGRGDFMARAV